MHWQDMPADEGRVLAAAVIAAFDGMRRGQRVRLKTSQEGTIVEKGISHLVVVWDDGVREGMNQIDAGKNLTPIR